ncbi:MAG: hypothetical protein AAF721_36115 [Myxococcota bacterium]
MLLSVAVASAVLALPSVSHAGTSCKSTWTKASAKVAKFFAPASKLVCKKLNTKDKAAADKCIADVQKYAAEADKIKKEWNKGEDGSWKIGPRALPTNRVQTGKVSTERQFVGQPILNDKYTVKIDRTGGKAKKDLIVKVCLVDEKGNDVHYKSVRLNKKSKSKTFSFEAAAGTMALIHLNNQKWGANAHQYTIKASASGEPKAVSQAKKTAKGSGKNKAKRGNRSVAPRR